MFVLLRHSYLLTSICDGFDKKKNGWRGDFSDYDTIKYANIRLHLHI